MSETREGENRSNPDIEVLAAVSEAAAYMVGMGRFPDGSKCRWCNYCDIGSPVSDWRPGCPECGASAGGGPPTDEVTNG